MSTDAQKVASLLAALDLPRQAARILAHEKYRSEAFCNHYLDRCEDIWFQDPQAGLEMAKAGLALTEQIAKQDCRDARSWCSLQVRALGILGSAHRTVCDFAHAEACFRVARFFFADDADDLTRANLFQRMVYLRRDQRRFGEAEHLANAAIDLYNGRKRYHLLGCALVDRGILYIYSNQSWKAVGDLFEAMSLIDREKNPRFYYSAAHNLAIALANDEGSSPYEALYWLKYARRLNDQPESSFTQVKLLWAEGRILKKQGEMAAAEHFLQTVRLRLLEHRTIADYALASLDLAEIYLEQGRTGQVRVLASEMYPIFRKLRTDREAFDALKLFHRAALAEALTFDLLHSVMATVRARVSSAA